MIIEKNDKIYVACENKESWTVSTKYGHIDVIYNVPKSDCPIFDNLKEFVAENDLF